MVLADSGAVAARLEGLDPHVVHCPIELDPPLVSAPWEDGSGPVIGFVGRIEPRKGPLDLALAAPAIHAARPDARIMIVGDDPYRSDAEYTATVRAAQGVEHIGWVPDAAGVMRHIDVLVAPSREEPFGTVLSEAMAVGTPVVATNVDGLPEVVTDGVDGVLVEPGDIDALAAAVLRVLDNREQMSHAAAHRGPPLRRGHLRGPRRVPDHTAGVRQVKVAFDSRAASDPRGIGRYVKCLLEALLETAGDDDKIIETHRSRGCDVYHSPWIDGASVRAALPTGRDAARPRAAQAAQRVPAHRRALPPALHGGAACRARHRPDARRRRRRRRAPADPRGAPRGHRGGAGARDEPARPR